MEKFNVLSTEKLLLIKKNKSQTELKILDAERLEVLIEFTKNYKPLSKIKSEKKDILEFLDIICKMDYNPDYKTKIRGLELTYFNSSIRKLANDGFRFKNAWLLSLFIILSFEIILYFILKQTFIFIPFLSILFASVQLYRDINAKKQNKLW